MEVEHYKKSTQTAHQTSEIVEHCNVLRCLLRGFEKLRSVYMPGLVQFLSDVDENLSFDEDSHPEIKTKGFGSRLQFRLTCARLFVVTT